MVKKCFVLSCKSGRKSERNNEHKFSLFKAPNDVNLLAKWRKYVPVRERDLHSQDRICEKHFETRYILPRWQQSIYGDYYEDHIRPKLTPDAVPTIFHNVEPTVVPIKAIRVPSENISNYTNNLVLPEVEVNESDYVSICYACLTGKCNSHIIFYK